MLSHQILRPVSAIPKLFLNNNAKGFLPTLFLQNIYYASANKNYIKFLNPVSKFSTINTSRAAISVNNTSDNKVQSGANSNINSSSTPAATTTTSSSSSSGKDKSKGSGFREFVLGGFITFYFAWDLDRFICFNNADHECNKYYESLLWRIKSFGPLLNLQSDSQDALSANNKNPFLPTIQFRLLLAYSLTAILSVKFLRNMKNQAFFDGNLINFLIPPLYYSLLISSVYSLNTAISKKKELQHEYLSLFYYHHIIQIAFFACYCFPMPLRLGKLLVKTHIFYSLFVIAGSEYSQFDHDWKPLFNGQVSLKQYSLAILNTILDGIPKEVRYLSARISSILSAEPRAFYPEYDDSHPVKCCALNHSKQLSKENCEKIVKQLVQARPSLVAGQLECTSGIANITSYTAAYPDPQIKGLADDASAWLRFYSMSRKATTSKTATTKSECTLQIPIKLYTEEESFGVLSITGEMIAEEEHDQNSTAKCNVYSVHYKNEFCLLQYEPTIIENTNNNLVSEAIQVTRFALNPLPLLETLRGIFRSSLHVNDSSSPSTIQPPVYVVPIGVNSNTLQVSSIHLIPLQHSSEILNSINIFPPRTVPTALTHIHEVSTTCTPIIIHNNINKAKDQVVELYNSEQTNEKLLIVKLQ